MLKLRVQRDPTTYMIKAFIPDCLVMGFGMAALFINPRIPPLMGGREARTTPTRPSSRARLPPLAERVAA